MRIPVAIINWDAIEMTAVCIDYLRKRTASDEIEIHVLDNGSRDPSNLERLKQLKDAGKIDRIISLQPNMGFSIAFNTLFQETAGDVFCYASSDCIVSEGWLEAGLDSLLSDPLNAAVCSSIYDDVHSDLPDADREIPQLYGAIMFIRRSAMIDIGCFDYRNFSPAYSEELDWSYRARKKGYSIMQSSNSIAYHNESYTMKKKYKESDIHLIRLTHRIKCRLYNWSLSDLRRGWKQYILETIDDAKGHTLHILLLAFFKNILILPSTIRERKKRQQLQTITFDYPYRRNAEFM